MKKIPLVFKRDPDDPGRALPEFSPDCQWVAAGQGVAMQKLDGTCCLIDAGGKFWKRRAVKPGKAPPAAFVLREYDSTTGKSFGWVPVEDGDPESRWHLEALASRVEVPRNGTYELVGPKIQGNPEHYPEHALVRHDDPELARDGVRRTFEGIREWLRGRDVEGVVFHHPDGRMAKIKQENYGLARTQEGSP